ncbi:hypothetical protein AB1Y20_013054 [Prymnesium parvum]|uniref:Uncharacterized protein n=1 Tax=Prymnesium parvum TaxID=97485 RepID=A0AB34IMA8_PRYPA
MHGSTYLRYRYVGMAVGLAVSASFLQEQAQKKEARAARFATLAAEPAPQLPARRIAWPGGKISSNKHAAVLAYLERKRQSEQGLSKSEEQRILASLERGGVRGAVVRPVEADAPSSPVARERGREGTPETHAPSPKTGGRQPHKRREKRRAPLGRRLLFSRVDCRIRTSAMRAFLMQRAKVKKQLSRSVS